MSAITDSAKGEDCMVRIPAQCNFNKDTTVPAHYSLSGFSGRGIKSPDWMIAYACSDCHDAIDGRAKKDKYGNEFMRDEVRLAHAEGVFRTQAILRKKGLIK